MNRSRLLRTRLQNDRFMWLKPNLERREERHNSGQRTILMEPEKYLPAKYPATAGTDPPLSMQ